jgi:hypothetical protein
MQTNNFFLINHPGNDNPKYRQIDMTDLTEELRHKLLNIPGLFQFYGCGYGRPMRINTKIYPIDFQSVGLVPVTYSIPIEFYNLMEEYGYYQINTNMIMSNDEFSACRAKGEDYIKID